MRATIRWSLTVVFGALVLATSLSAQKQGQIFLSITSPDGKRVEGVTTQDVTVTEDGTSCKTTKVEAVDWPTKLQILVDNGRSNTNPINPLRDGLKGLLAELPDGVEVSLYTTAGSVRPVVKPTTDKQKVVDAIPLVAPDSGAGMFFDALFEASERADKDKMPGYPMIVMIGSDFGTVRALDRDFQKLQMNIFNHGIKTFIVLNVGGQGGVAGGAQVDIGINVAKMSGGRYENINGTTRLATLLPEIGKQLAESIKVQSHQYRVTYDVCSKPNDKGGTAIGAEVRKDGAVKLSLRGTQ
jgi:hypothetical protein